MGKPVVESATFAPDPSGRFLVECANETQRWTLPVVGWFTVSQRFRDDGELDELDTTISAVVLDEEGCVMPEEEYRFAYHVTSWRVRAAA